MQPKFRLYSFSSELWHSRRLSDLHVAHVVMCELYSDSAIWRLCFASSRSWNLRLSPSARARSALMPSTEMCLRSAKRILILSFSSIGQGMGTFYRHRRGVGVDLSSRCHTPSPDFAGINFGKAYLTESQQ